MSGPLPPAPPRIMGIVNTTDDSFFDGGRFLSLDAALAHARLLLAEGADLLDIGGQSTRPGYAEISPEEEIARTAPLIRALTAESSIPLSIDTYKPSVARAALAAGASLLNDIHGLQGHPDLAPLAAEYGAAVVIMHHDPSYPDSDHDLIGRMKRFFEKSLQIAERAGLPRTHLILDPGIGFAKTQPQNLALLARLGELRSFGLPLLLGASRKSVIAHVLDLPPAERLEATLATTTLAVWQGVDILRVHDVRANRRAALMTAALRSAAAAD